MSEANTMKMESEDSWSGKNKKLTDVNVDNKIVNKEKEKESSDNDSTSNESGSDSDSDSESDSSSSSNKSKASASSSVSHSSKKSNTSSKSSSSHADRKQSPSPSLPNSEPDEGIPKTEEYSDNTNENSMDVDSNKKRGKLKGNKEIQKLIETYPDVYGVRRSSRCRKEPERYTMEAESDASDGKKGKKKSRRKDSGDWDGTEESRSEQSAEDGESEPGRKTRQQPNKKVFNKSRSKTVKGKPRQRIKKVAGSSSSDDSEHSDDDRRGSARSSRKKVSYKEQSDHTDSEDLVDVDWGDYNAEADIGDVIEKVLEHRIGRKGATGVLTTPFNVELTGDPNEAEEGEVEDQPDIKQEGVSKQENGERIKKQKELQFLIKWKGSSHIHNTWESEESLKSSNAKGIKKLENYLKREDEIKYYRDTATPEDIEYFDCQEEMAQQLRQLYLTVERIIAHQPSKSTETCHPEYLCKWEGLAYADCTFEEGALINRKFPKKIEEYHQRQKSQKIPSKLCRALKTRPKFVPLKTQPSYIGGSVELELRDYQLDGLNWLAHSWCKENSVILADEMGLGKTIQSVSFFSNLFNQHMVYGPFLLVVPLSTMAAWQKEFEKWAPELNLVVYIGDVSSRNMIRSYEWCHPGNKRLKFNVLLTTYEILLKDKGFLGSVAWAAIGVDEAHRLKNDDSLLYKSLFEFDTNHRILITGTPLQNSLRELWALLHFIMPSKFATWEEFEAEHDDSDSKGYSKLHKQLEPFLLRRVKKDVEKSLPAKVEQILRVEMTSVQKQYYKYILTKNYKALTKGLKGSLSGFANIMMELKKCCNHATLIRPTDDLNHLDNLTRIVRGSGKLVLLDKLLVRLRETGHRVLVFSQMVRMLDILSDYLTMRRFPFQRLDGSIKGEIRKQALDHFNADGSQDFCFLLSTRAGGLGINLATADTVIIFDSDWNPQNDLQAQARAHRIGQKNQVNIYRLVTKGSVEEDILERAKQKMVLDHLVIQRMDTTGKTVLSKGLSNNAASSNSTPFNKEELAQILKFGAEELFKEGEDKDEEPHVDIDEILKRAETREEAPTTASDELLSAFKVASFNFNEEDVSTNINIKKEDSRDKDWDQIIPEAERARLDKAEKDKEEMEMFLPPRSRKLAQQQAAGHSDSGDEYDPTVAREKGDGSEDSEGDGRPKRRGKPKFSAKESIKGFTETEIRRFVKSFKKFPAPIKRLESIAVDAELQEKPINDLKHLAEVLQTGCEAAVKEHQNKINMESHGDDGQAAKKRDRGPNFKLAGVSVFPKSVLTCQQELEPLETLMPQTSEERKRWVLKAKIKDVKDWDVPWNVEDDSRLLAGAYEYGVGSWEAIKMDPTYCLAEKILPDGAQKPQTKQLQARVEYLLKLMQRVIAAQKIQEEALKPRKKRLPKVVKEKEEGSTDGHKPGADGKEKKKKEKTKEKGKEDKGLNPRKDQEGLVKKKKDKKKDKEKKGKKEKGHKKSKEKKEKKKKKRDINAPAMHFTANAEPQVIDAAGDLEPQIFSQCKEKMRPLKKALKQLDKPDVNLSEADKFEHMNQCLLKIGARISECLDEYKDTPEKAREWRNHLWTFVSKFTEFSPKRVYKMFKAALKKDGGDGVRDERHRNRYHRRHNYRRHSPHGHKSGASGDEVGHGSNFFASGVKRPADSSSPSPTKRAREEGGRVPIAGQFEGSQPTNYPYPAPPSSASSSRHSWPTSHSPRDDRPDKFRSQPYGRSGNSPEKKFQGDRQRFRNDRPPPGNYPPNSALPNSYSQQFPPYYGNAPGGAMSAPTPGHPYPVPNAAPYPGFNNHRDPRDRNDWSRRPDNYRRDSFGSDEKPTINNNNSANR